MISINVRGQLREIVRAQRSLETAEFSQAAGGAVARLLQNHFVERNQRPNRLGGTRTNYWAAAAKAISYEASPDGVTVTVSHVGIGHHYRGGTIRPVNSRYLTIPNIPEAHGRRASEFDNLRAVIFRQGSLGALIEDVSGFQVDEPQVVYWLVASVTKRPDPTVLPTERQIVDTALAAIASHLRSLQN